MVISFPIMPLNTSAGTFVVSGIVTLIFAVSPTASMVSITSWKSLPGTVMSRLIFLSALSTTVPPSFAAGMVTVTVLSEETVYVLPS